MGVTILLPTFNEEASIGEVIDSIRSLSDGYKIVVIDGPSTDRTRDIVLNKGATLLTENRRGKGIAIRTAFESLRDDYYVMLNADGTYSVEAIPKILEELEKYDVVICPRVRGKGSMPLLHIIWNWFLTKLANLLYGTHIRELCTGMWGLRQSVVSSLELTSVGFTLEADLFVNCFELGCTIGEVPVLYKPRVKGKAKLRPLDGLKIAWFLIERRLR